MVVLTKSVLKAGSFRLQGTDALASNFTYSSTINLELLPNHCAKGTVVFESQDGETDPQSPFSGSWKDDGTIEYKMFYNGMWFDYFGTWEDSHLNGTFIQSEYVGSEEIPDHAHGIFSHQVAALVEPGRYSLDGNENCDSGANYGVSIDIYLLTNGFVKGVVTFNHENGDEGVIESPFSGSWSEDGEVKYSLFYSGFWFSYSGNWNGSTFVGTFFESDWLCYEDAPENRRGEFSHTISVKPISMGTYKLEGTEKCENGTTYNSTWEVSIKQNGRLSGAITYQREDFQTDDTEGVYESPFSGEWQEDGTVSWKSYCAEVWYDYAGNWDRSSCTGTYFESDCGGWDQASVDQKGTFEHSVTLVK